MRRGAESTPLIRPVLDALDEAARREVSVTRPSHIRDSVPNMRDSDEEPKAPDLVDARLAARLAELRAERGWSLGSWRSAAR